MGTMDLICSELDSRLLLTIWVVPNSLANVRRLSSTSMAMILEAPAAFATIMAASPTAPTPRTATLEFTWTRNELNAAPAPV
jgi:hypothetical protein